MQHAYTVSTDQGHHGQAMHDAYFVVERKEFAVFGVATGHLKAEAALWVGEHLEAIAVQTFALNVDQISINNLFRCLQCGIVLDNLFCGTTLSLLILDFRLSKAWCANVGDSPIYITPTPNKFLSRTI